MSSNSDMASLRDSRAEGARANETAPSTSSEPAQVAQPAHPAHLRSCVLCKKRKVKCDRGQPCTNCVRAGAKCVHPPGAGRAAKRSRQADAKVLDRLTQLETTIIRLQQQAKDRDASSHLPFEPAQSQGSRDLVDNANQGTETAPELGRLVVEESQSRYVSNVMWADLTESIEQLRGMFLDTNSKDDESSQHDDSPSFCDAESPNPGSSGPNAAILGYRSLAHSLRDFHPSVELSMRLFQLFNDNVLPVVRIFHTQTLIRLFWSAVVKPDSIDKETEALLFAIYYSAIVSINPDQCANVVGEPRSSVIERYKFAAEQALARANLLNTHSTLLLQAAVLYVSVLRSEDGTRTVWSLIALTSHVARSMGFHRDGTFFNLSPFETEMRRRIWHHICLLDHRSTEYHGYEPTVVDETAFDTRWPLNVNDSDLSSDMTEPPSESVGSTEMTLTRTRCHALRISRKMKRQSRSPFPERVKIVDEYDEWVEKYVERCDPAQPLLYLSNEISYIIAARFRAVTYYHELLLRKKREEANASRTKNERAGVEASQGRSEVEPDNKTLRDQLFAAAVTILGRTVSIMQDPRLDRWAWHSHIYVQWQTIALVLSEICIRPPSPLCDAAWEHVSAIYDRWLRVKFRDGTERGDDFLKPIGQLIAKTQGVRSLQQAQQQARQQAQQHHYPTQTQTTTPGAGGLETPGQRMLYDTPGNQTSSLNLGGLDTMCVDALSHQADLDLAATTASPSAISGNDPPLYEIIGFDPFLEMLPDELQNVWYESVARDNSNPHNDAPETKPFFDFP